MEKRIRINCKILTEKEKAHDFMPEEQMWVPGGFYLDKVVGYAGYDDVVELFLDGGAMVIVDVPLDKFLALLAQYGL